MAGSNHAPFSITLLEGYDEVEGLDVVIDRSKRCTDVVGQLASGSLLRGHNIVMDVSSQRRGGSRSFDGLRAGRRFHPRRWSPAGRALRLGMYADLALLARRSPGWTARGAAAIEHAGGGESRLGPRLRRWL